MKTDNNILKIESGSNPDKFYVVNTSQLTCTCPMFTRKLKGLAKDDPHRLCKHLVQAILNIGIPESLSQYKDDIVWFAKQKAGFTTRNSVQKNNKLSVPVGTVQTISVNKKMKYGYLEAVVVDKKISAVVPLEGGSIAYTINNLNAHYNTLTQESFIPISYRHIEKAIVFWLVDEYNNMRKESAALAIPMEFEYVPIEKEFPIDCVQTISIQTKKGLIDFKGLIDNFDGNEYFEIKGIAVRESIEAIIRNTNNVISYSINGSKVYSLDMAPLTEQHTVAISKIGSLTITSSSDFSDNFPKSYWFIQKAVIKWLRDNYERLIIKSSSI